MKLNKEDDVPLYITLHRYKALFVTLSLAACILCFDMWFWFKENHTYLSAEGMGGFISLALAAIGVLKYSMEHAVKKSEE